MPWFFSSGLRESIVSQKKPRMYMRGCGRRKTLPDGRGSGGQNENAADERSLIGGVRASSSGNCPFGGGGGTSVSALISESGKDLGW